MPFSAKEKVGLDRAVAGPKANSFVPHPNYGDRVNRNMVQSESEGGVFLDNQLEAAIPEIETHRRFLTIVNSGRGQALILDHPEFCPVPTLGRIDGST